MKSSETQHDTNNAVNRAIRTFEAGRFDEAAEICEEALVDSKDQPILVYLKDLIPIVREGNSQVIRYLESYIAVHPDSRLAHSHLGAAHKSEGKKEIAIQHFQKAVHSAPWDRRAALHLLTTILEVHQVQLELDLESTLILIMENGTVFPDKIFPVAQTIWRSNGAIRQLLAISKNQDREALNKTISDGSLTSILARPLFLGLLAETIFTSAEWEWLLRELRQVALFDLAHENLFRGDNPSVIALFSAIAKQCFLNEYVYWTDPVERTTAMILAENVASDLAEHITLSTYSVALLACYQPLCNLEHYEQLETISFDPIRPETLISRHVSEPKRERALEKLIPRMGKITDSVSIDVREQYEENPYPRWIHLEAPPRAPFWKTINKAFPLANMRHLKNLVTPKVLVAGCGTGMQPISVALNFNDTHVTAIDITLASLAYAKRKTEERGLTRVEYIQNDILNVADLGICFDFIACTGVLHHMAEPIEGWRRLAQCLQPGGIMDIALYSDIARSQIVDARKLVSDLQYESSGDGIRQFRKDLMDKSFRIHQMGPLMDTLMHTQDFYTLSMCRDLIFHTNEHRFTLPKIEEALLELDLTFIGFIFETKQYLTEYRSRFPDDPGVTNLRNWHLFELENRQTFMGTYRFLVQKQFNCDE